MFIGDCMHLELKPGRVFLGRFDYNDDLLDSLTKFCEESNIKLGVFNVIGAVQNAKLGYYNQDEKKYTGCVELNKKLEISSCMVIFL